MVRLDFNYELALLKLMDSLPNRQGPLKHVLRSFEERYHAEIPPGHFSRNKSGAIRWVHRVQWKRQRFVNLGLMDAPQRGVWQLTERGHRWLAEHPNATRFVDDDSLGQAAGAEATPELTSRSLPDDSQVDIPQITYKAFFLGVRSGLDAALPKEVKNLPPEFETKANRFLLHLPGYKGCHYEVHLGHEHHEIGIRFHSTKPRVNEARRQAFEPYLERLSAALEHPVLAEVFGPDQIRTRVWIRLPVSALTEALAKHYGTLAGRLIEETLPTLKSIYADRASRRMRVGGTGPTPQDVQHLLLDREIGAIRAFLDGRSDHRPSDERLCDWVQFCYTFELFDEAVRLYAMVSPDDVNPWYFNRTKKLAAICQVRVQGR